MNTNNIKKYAPQARNDFRDAVVQKLTTLGIAADKKGNLQIAEAETIGETVRYGQFDYPLSTLPRRERLVKRAREQGFEVLVEHCAYTGLTAYVQFAIWSYTVILSTASVCCPTRRRRPRLRCWIMCRKWQKPCCRKIRRSWLK